MPNTICFIEDITRHAHPMCVGQTVTSKPPMYSPVHITLSPKMSDLTSIQCRRCTVQFLKLLKVLPCIPNVDQHSCRGYTQNNTLKGILTQENRKGGLRRALSDEMTMTYVFEVNTSMKAAKCEFRTSMLWK